MAGGTGGGHVNCLFYKWLQCDSCCVCFYVDTFFSLSLVPLTRGYCVSHLKLFVKSWSDHYSVGFLGKKRVFLGIYPTLYIIIRHLVVFIISACSDLLSLFILLPCFDAGSALGSVNCLHLMAMGKTRNLPQILRRYSLLARRGLDLCVWWLAF